MPQSGYTPILIYSSSTAGNSPAAGNLLNNSLGSELAINITDGKLFYKDDADAVQVISWKVTPTSAGGTGLTSFTANGVMYASSSSVLATGSALQFNGTDLTVTLGNLIPGSAAKGINFTANTPASGMTSQLLNWYEEGAWTPASGVGTATSVSGVYTRIGRQVTIIGTLTFPVQTNAGLATITGMPFASGATGSGATLRYTDYGSAFFLYGDASATTMGCYSTAGAGLTYTQLSGKRVDFAMTYFI